MMDRDFPIDARHAKFTVGALLVGGAFGLLLFGGALPGLTPHYAPPKFYELNGEPYYWSSYIVPTPLFFGNSTPYTSIALANVTFHIHVAQYVTETDLDLVGNATMPNGTVYPFTLVGRPSPADRVSQFLSPDGAVGVVWNMGLVAYVLVRA